MLDQGEDSIYRLGCPETNLNHHFYFLRHARCREIYIISYPHLQESLVLILLMLQATYSQLERHTFDSRLSATNSCCGIDNGAVDQALDFCSAFPSVF